MIDIAKEAARWTRACEEAIGDIFQRILLGSFKEPNPRVNISRDTIPPFSILLQLSSALHKCCTISSDISSF